MHIENSSPENLLKSIFGYNEFRPFQREIIENILEKKDTLAILPTGGGKSLCYQIPAIIFDGLTIVISPLISLMKDQIEQLRELGISAVVLNSSISKIEYNENLIALQNREVKLLYLAPETLLRQKIIDLIKTLSISLITVDEAHCISEWGHEFRPEYRRLLEIKDFFPKTAWAAFTATATPRVQKDISETLGFESKNVFIASFNRENLFLDVVAKTSPYEQALEFISSFKEQPGIIYCTTRKQVDALAENLIGEGFKAKPYHAGLTDEERSENQSLFIKDDIDIIVATIAFGMGINKPDIRFILHYDLPKNIESYYQQIGRAGRDGIQSYCRLLFSYGDISKIRYFINRIKIPIERQIAEIHLNAMIDFAESVICRRNPLINYFGEVYNEENCNMCDNCTDTIEDQTDITVQSQKFLSCIARSKEYFGCGHLIDILRGSNNEKILKLKHNELTTYNIGKEFSKTQWNVISNELIRQKYVRRDENGVLKLNKSAWKVFKNEIKIYCSGIEETKPKTNSPTQNNDYDIALYDKLRYLRKELADKKGIPPFAVFSNKTLTDICIRYPQSATSFSRIYGVGKNKAEKYGNLFLDIIRRYCSENNIIEKVETSHKIVKTKKGSKGKIAKSEEVASTFQMVGDLEKVARHLRIQPSSVIDHLYKHVRSEKPLSNSDALLKHLDLEEEVIKTVFFLFEELGCNYLKPVLEEFEEDEISYEDLKILRIVFLSS